MVRPVPTGRYFSFVPLFREKVTTHTFCVTPAEGVGYTRNNCDARVACGAVTRDDMSEAEHDHENIALWRLLNSEATRLPKYYNKDHQ